MIKTNKIVNKKTGFILVVLLLWWWFSLPTPLFDKPLSTVLEDKNSNLLGAQIADDGQWRFPPSDSIPDKFSTAVISFEDKRFRSHQGVDFRSLARASWQNIKAATVVSGASTISMQTIRMSRNNPPRTLWQKGIEILLAIRLDLTYSKGNILNLWASNAPFGGNVVGLEAASWRYYGKAPTLLSWSEAATLAVLPNSPALIHPGRNRNQLRNKRNQLLQTLLNLKHIEKEDYQLALLEPLPVELLPLPRISPHLLDRVKKEKGAGRWQVSINKDLQENINRIAKIHHQKLSGNDIHNLAILVTETNSGKVLAYLGNSASRNRSHSPDVDLVTAARSPGSLLKPILYSLALEDGKLLPSQLLSDVPCFFNGFKPENFHENYDGAIQADQALSRSLNIPFVFLLKHYGVQGFHKALQKWQFSHINQPPGHYGLSLILGGCEVSLWQAVGWYGSLGRMVSHHYSLQGEYDWTDWHLPLYLEDEHISSKKNKHLEAEPFLVGSGAGWFTLNALQFLERPSNEGNWEQFRSSRRMAWKTGTSFGFRDAWAVGVTPDYTIGIWVGNADGEGRPGLVGIQAAAPILFDVLRLLPDKQSPWFEQPFDDCRKVEICSMSGFLATTICPTDSIWIPKNGGISSICDKHELIHLNSDKNYQVNQSCAGNEKFFTEPWFSLPPLEAHYYQKRHPEYLQKPPWHPSCNHSLDQTSIMQWIYPQHSGKIQLARNWKGELMPTIFSLAHQHDEKKVYWHLDDRYLGDTQNKHQMELEASTGVHQLIVTDEDGIRLEKFFELIE